MKAFGCLKSPGKLIFIFLLSLLFYSDAFPGQVETELMSGRIEKGESTTLQVKVNGADDAEPVQVPSVKGLIISFNGTQNFSSTQIINFKVQRSSGVILSFSIQGQKSGKYQIPPIIIKADGKTVRSRPVALLVSSGAGIQKRSAGAVYILPLTKVSSSRVYTGEPVILRFYLLHTGLEMNSKPEIEKLPEATGFVIRNVEELLDDGVETVDGVEYIKTHISTYILAPAKEGVFEVGGGSAILEAVMPDRFFSFTFPKRRRIVFDKEKITVLPLPEKGKPANYQGNVGSFTIKAEKDDTPVKVFGEKKIKIRISGTGNFLSLSRPFPGKEIPGLKVIAEEGSQSLEIKDGKLTGDKTFLYTLIPEKQGDYDCGPYIINFYNPATGQYEIQKSEDITFTATGDAAPRSELSFNDEKEKGSSADFNIVMVVLLLALFASVVLAVIIWERKKYTQLVNNREQAEPEDNKRQKEEKNNALYRQMLSAARKSDAENFLKYSENFLRTLESSVREQDGSNPGISKVFNDTKEKLYGHKYGGGKIDTNEINGIMKDIKSIVDQIK